MQAPKLVILGRDGILNRFRDDHVKAPAEWLPIHGALEAVARLNHAGWHAVVATNQAGIGRGMIDMASLNAVHVHMMKLLAQHGGRLDAVFFCPHTPQENCDCRKPLPGMMRQIAQRYGVDLANAGRRLPAAPGAFRPCRGRGRRPGRRLVRAGAPHPGARRPGRLHRSAAARRSRRRRSTRLRADGSERGLTCCSHGRARRCSSSGCS
jgi:histidinol-phosphate phosphatase family protein